MIPLAEWIDMGSNNSPAIVIIYLCYTKLIVLQKERLMLEK